MTKYIGACALTALLLAQAPTIPRVGANPKMSWGAPTTNEDGSPLTDLGGFEIAVSQVDVDLAVGGTPLKIFNLDATKRSHQFSMKDLPSGVYRYWIRTLDTAGNTSKWVMVEADTDTVSPGPPVEFKILVNIGGQTFEIVGTVRNGAAQ